MSAKPRLHQSYSTNFNSKSITKKSSNLSDTPNLSNLAVHAVNDLADSLSQFTRQVSSHLPSHLKSQNHRLDNISLQNTPVFTNPAYRETRETPFKDPKNSRHLTPNSSLSPPFKNSKSPYSSFKHQNENLMPNSGGGYQMPTTHPNLRRLDDSYALRSSIFTVSIFILAFVILVCVYAVYLGVWGG